MNTCFSQSGSLSRRWKKALVLVWSIALTIPFALPCTTVVIGQGESRYFARNLDWPWENGLIIVNQRGIQKTSLAPPKMPVAHWASKYGSVTFNQFGQEMPFGGMNEAGLIVECMWLDDTQYAPADDRAAINLLQWIQYQLDNCRTVDDVIATDSRLRVYAPVGSARIHYLVADAGGGSAAIEFLGGKMVSYRGTNLPAIALANDPYERSMEQHRDHPPGGGIGGGSSQARFEQAWLRAQQFKPGTVATNVQYTFETLDEVAQRNTIWSVVYDISARQIYFRTRNNSQIRTIRLRDLKFTCGQLPQFVDVEEAPNPEGQWNFQSLSEMEQRKYLEHFISDPSVERRFGDLRQQIGAQLGMLRGFSCDEQPPSKLSAAQP